MVLEPVCYPHCHTTDVVKNGNSAEGKQRYRCRNTDSRASFILDYTYRGHVPEVKQLFPLRTLATVPKPMQGLPMLSLILSIGSNICAKSSSFDSSSQVTT